MSESKEKATVAAQDAFNATFQTIMSGYAAAGRVADKGAGLTFLAAGLASLTVGLALKVYAVLAGALVKTSIMTTADFAAMVAASIVLMLCGTAIRIWDRILGEKAADRDAHLRAKAADKASLILEKAAELTRDAHPAHTGGESRRSMRAT